MAPQKEKTLNDLLKLVSPGTPMRTTIDDVVRSNIGALIVFDSPQLREQNTTEGGFRINSRFTPQSLFELCKMDGAIIISSDLKRILQANTLITPDNTIPSVETGIRHKTAERIAKQAQTSVIAISARRKKTTLYHSSFRYHLRSTEKILRNIDSNLQILEKQRDIFENNLVNLNILEMSEMASIKDVCKVLQRSEIILKISESIKRNFTELGREGTIAYMRYHELLKNIEKSRNEILRDYSPLSLKKAKTLLTNIKFDGLLELEIIARLMFNCQLDNSTSPKGYRFLAHTTTTKRENSQIIRLAGNLNNVIKLEPKDLEPILKNRSQTVCEEIKHIQEQIINEKITC